MDEATGGRLLTEVERRLRRAAVIANLLGALDLYTLAVLLLPVRPKGVDTGHVALVNTIVFVPLMTATLVVGHRWGRRQSERLRPWLESGRAPTPAEHAHALRLAVVQTRIAAALWAAATVVFTLLNAVLAGPIAAVVAVTMVLGGTTTTSLTYLLADRIMRPIVACALAAGLPERPARPGVRGRVTLVWLCATGVPLLGIGATAVLGLVGSDASRTKLAVSVLFLALFAGVAGLAATLISARALADPLAAVRGALERIEQGAYDAHVEVDDASELGLVEAGFNRMAAGLRERERVRDAFGRHVGRDVATVALSGELKLGGETREVGVLFVDLIGSTTLAGRLEPEHVVALLNDFFAVVVAVIEAHGGFVNKFEGDGALCVFGAPVARDDPAGAALAAGRELRARVVDALPQIARPSESRRGGRLRATSARRSASSTPSSAIR